MLNEPLLGYGTVIDRGVVLGEPFSSYQQVANSQWQPFADQVPAFEFFISKQTPNGFRAVPARPERSYVRAVAIPPWSYYDAEGNLLAGRFGTDVEVPESVGVALDCLYDNIELNEATMAAEGVKLEVIAL